MSNSDFQLPTANNMNGNGNNKATIEQAGDKAQETVGKIADAARPAVDRIASGAHLAVDKLVKAASTASETLGAKGEQLNEIQQRMVEDARLYVRAKPVTAIGFAVAAGFLLSRILKSR